MQSRAQGRPQRVAGSSSFAVSAFIGRPRPGRCLRTNATFRFIEVNGGGTCASSSRGPWAAKDKQTLAQDGDAGGGNTALCLRLSDPKLRSDRERVGDEACPDAFR